MPDTINEHWGNRSISYKVETAREYTERTGEYLGGDCGPLVSAIELFEFNQHVGAYISLAKCRDWLKNANGIVSSIPVIEK